MRILFLHGWQSTSGGIKPTYLKDHGHEVLNPALPDDDFDAAVRIAQAEFDRHRPEVIVGSSRGGAVAMNIASGDTPVVLLCPAWKRWGTVNRVKPGTVILHSQADEVVPFADSQELLRRSGLSEAALIAVGTEHRLADDDSLRTMLEAVEKAARAHEAVGTPVRKLGWRRLCGILLCAMSVYAPLFAATYDGAWESWKVLAIVVIALFLVAIGVAQKRLYAGKRPLMASLVMGASFCVALYVFYSAVVVYFHIVLKRNANILQFPLAPFDPVEAAWFGAVGGYVVGLPIAAVFWVIGRVVKSLQNPKRTVYNGERPANRQA
jgi:hypothetical protein